MDNSTHKSILQMARGAIQERADYEMSRLLANILDVNTKATAKRTLTLTLELKPDDTRQNIAVSWILPSVSLAMSLEPMYERFPEYEAVAPASRFSPSGAHADGS